MIILIIIKLQYGFQQKYLITHALIHWTNKIRLEIDKGNYACGIFADFQKALSTIDHHKQFKKLEYYGVREISKKSFTSYLSKGS